MKKATNNDGIKDFDNIRNFVADIVYIKPTDE